MDTGQCHLVSQARDGPMIANEASSVKPGPVGSHGVSPSKSSGQSNWEPAQSRPPAEATRVPAHLDQN